MKITLRQASLLCNYLGCGYCDETDISCKLINAIIKADYISHIIDSPELKAYKEYHKDELDYGDGKDTYLYVLECYLDAITQAENDPECSEYDNIKPIDSYYEL